ncbi:hypothetical protein [Amycolatopsis albispora]|uniref:hypothetical protein n=1 Tax=Amycolatopsis albispora TaxID=1804986 RepID=UPI0013B387E2|nr:hypothetical protein [Amycolatopsis albispora]
MALRGAVIALVATGCTAAPPATPEPSPTPTPPVSTTAPPSREVAVAPPVTAELRTAETGRTTTKAKPPPRPAPTAGYQCRDGDEERHEVCAEHKRWVDGQVEFTNCLDSGGVWDEEAQRCEPG